MTHVQAMTRCLQTLDPYEKARLYRNVIALGFPVLCGPTAKAFKQGIACCPATFAAYENPHTALPAGTLDNVQNFREVRNVYSKLTTASHSLGFGDFGELLGKLNATQVREAIRAARG